MYQQYNSSYTHYSNVNSLSPAEHSFSPLARSTPKSLSKEDGYHVPASHNHESYTYAGKPQYELHSPSIITSKYPLHDGNGVYHHLNLPSSLASLYPPHGGHYTSTSVSGSLPNYHLSSGSSSHSLPHSYSCDSFPLPHTKSSLSQTSPSLSPTHQQASFPLSPHSSPTHSPTHTTRHSSQPNPLKMRPTLPGLSATPPSSSSSSPRSSPPASPRANKRRRTDDERRAKHNDTERKGRQKINSEIRI